MASLTKENQLVTRPTDIKPSISITELNQVHIKTIEK